MLCEPFMCLLPIIKTTSYKRILFFNQTQALPHTITTKHTKCSSSCSTKGYPRISYIPIWRKKTTFWLCLRRVRSMVLESFG